MKHLQEQRNISEVLAAATGLVPGRSESASTLAHKTSFCLYDLREVGFSYFSRLRGSRMYITQKIPFATKNAHSSDFQERHLVPNLRKAILCLTVNARRASPSGRHLAVRVAKLLCRLEMFCACERI